MSSRRVKPEPTNFRIATGWYARLSRYVLDQTSTERQLADEKKFSELYDLPPGREYVDIDVSAYRDVYRPAYEQMLLDVQAGRLSHIVIWKIDRIARNLTEFMRFQRLCDKHGVTVRSVNDPYDTSTPIGRAIVQILAVFAELESATISLRVTSAKQTAASKGRWSGGGTRGFGLTKDRTALIPEEAELIRGAAERVLQGESLGTIAREWTAAGVKTPGGKDWTTKGVSQLLRSPHVAGLRVHQGEVVGEAGWPAILDRATWEALGGLHVRTRPRPRRSYLLGGLLACGVCGEPLGAHMSKGKRAYRCLPPPQRRGCGGLSILADPVEEYVTAACLGALQTPEIAPALSHPKNGGGDEKDLIEALRAAERRLVELGEDYAKGLVPRTAFQSATASLDETIGDLSRRMLRAAEANRVVLVGPDPAVEWGRRDLTWRAGLVAALFEVPIVVRPAFEGRDVQVRVRLVPRP